MRVNGNDYVEKNRGYITASKLKYFLTYGPEAYYHKFVLEEKSEDENKDYYITGTAFDDLLSYGKDFFFDHYYIDEGLLKDDLIEMCKNLGLDTSGKIEDLRKRIYGDKIKLTKSQGDQIVGMYNEAMRQPLVDLGNPNYEKQKTIECNFEGMKLRGTLDRLSLKDNMIRDWKTSGQFQNFEYNLETTFDYILSMSFYYVLVKVQYNQECEVILDVFGKNKPYPYMGYKLDKPRLLSSLENKIIPGLRALKDCMKKNKRESIYPIDFVTQNRYGDVITHKKGEPIPRTKLMDCEFYSKLNGGISEHFITPSF